MTKQGTRVTCILILASVCTSCGSGTSPKVLTVEEAVPQIDALNGRTASVAGYLPACSGYDCILFRNKADADEWKSAMSALRANKETPLPDRPVFEIGSGPNYDFDAKAAAFVPGYVVIMGTVTNKCRFKGQPACLDRGGDLDPRSIRAWKLPRPD